MDTAQLRALQAPLKQQYRENAATAQIPARAEARIDQDAIACSVTAWVGQTEAGLHPAAGGDGSTACSADMLLEALVACAGVTMASVATAMGIEIRSGRVVADGTWDARGTLGIDRRVPVGLTTVSLRFELDTDADRATVDKLVQLTERYCVIFQTLQHPPTIDVDVQVGPPPA